MKVRTKVIVTGISRKKDEKTKRIIEAEREEEEVGERREILRVNLTKT